MAPVGMQQWEEPPAGSIRDSACALLLDIIVNWLKLDQLPNGGCVWRTVCSEVWAGGAPGPPSPRGTTETATHQPRKGLGTLDPALG
jgi:hypothetical protein